MTTSTPLQTLLAILGIVGSVITVITGLLKLADIGVAAGSVLIVGVSAVLFAAFIGAVVTLVAVIIFVVDRCSGKAGMSACAAGVVNAIVGSFASASDYLFPFSAMHDRVDLVVKATYWPLVQGGAGFVKCGTDALPSPILMCFFESAEVCRAGAGSIVGAVIGAVLGILAGAAIGAAIGCATVVLCIFAIIVAVIVAALAVLIGALIVGLLALAAGSNTSPSAGSTTIKVGDYLTTPGNYLAHGEFQGAIVAWFVTQPVTLHGASMSGEGPGGGAPFSHTDPDVNLVPDACPV